MHIEVDVHDSIEGFPQLENRNDDVVHVAETRRFVPAGKKQKNNITLKNNNINIKK